jgi:membrane fusion protein
MTALFRREALRAKSNRAEGAVLHYSPLAKPVAGASLAIALGVVAIVVFGHYTRTVSVAGYLVPETGIVRVFAPQPGIIVERPVATGSHVDKGDTLYIVSAERSGRGQGQLLATAAETLRDRRKMVAEQIDKTRNIQAVELDRLRSRRDQIVARRGLIDQKIDILARSVALRQEIFDRKKALAERNISTVEQAQQVELNLLDQRGQLAALQLDRQAVADELATADLDLRSKPMQQANDVNSLRKELLSLDQQLAEAETRRENVIVAPEAGIVSVVLAEVGQAVTSTQSLAVIQPDGTNLQVNLFAPSRAIGFVKVGDAVRLRYQAFPYQKFGQYEGTVQTIARTALSSSEVAALQLPQIDQTEPLYRIVVAPAAQFVRAYGENVPLQAGMTVDAYVLQETRTIYEWILEPLYSVRGFAPKQELVDAH